MRCCGTLEFVCDFQATCQETQHQLHAKVAEEAAETNNDVEANKENTEPPKTSPEIDEPDCADVAPISKAAEEAPVPASTPGQVLESKILADITEAHCPDTAAKENSPPRRGRKRKQSQRSPMHSPHKIAPKRPRGRPPKRKVTPERVAKPAEPLPPVKKRIPAAIPPDKVKKPEMKALAVAAVSSSHVKSNEAAWTPGSLMLPEPETPESSAAVASRAREPILTPADSPEDPEPSQTLVESPEEVDDRRRSRRRKKLTYGRMSELISAEQKKIIEKSYTIDMSVIKEDVVEEYCTVNSKKQIVCKLCQLVYDRADKCHVHIWGHLDMKPYRCVVCNFTTVTITNIRAHIRKCHLKIKPFECDICDKRFATAVLLEEHINTHTGAKPFECPNCEFATASRQVLSYHVKIHKGVKDVTCDICQKQFYTKGRLRSHILIHNKDRSLMCKFCSQRFTNHDSLQRHYDRAHSKDYVCATCGKSTRSKKALHNHQNVHSEAKFKCPLCPNIYKSSHILKEHVLKHKGIRKYKCDVCDKDFAQQSHLAAHKAVHSSKRYECPGCQRTFNRADNMKMHARKCDLVLEDPELQDILGFGRRKRGRSRKNISQDAEIEDSSSEDDVDDKVSELSDKTDLDSSLESDESLDEAPDSPESTDKSGKIKTIKNVLPLNCF